MFGLLLLAAAHASPHLAFPRDVTPQEKAAIAETVVEGFKDPSSAQFRWPPIMRPDLYCGQVNAKNSYGGFVGYRMFSVRLSRIGGRVSAYLNRINDVDSLDATQDAQDCAKSG